jgi:hypothetical protein
MELGSAIHSGALFVEALDCPADLTDSLYRT